MILRHYLDIERGDLARALARYNGSLGKNSGYAAKVTECLENALGLAGRAGHARRDAQPAHAVCRRGA